MNSNENTGEIYEISLKGHLNEKWDDWFDGLTITLKEDGNTVLSGSVIDDAALHGVLKKIRDLGLTLLSVNLLGSDRIDSKE
jgi:hypothetical protein